MDSPGLRQQKTDSWEEEEEVPSEWYSNEEEKAPGVHYSVLNLTGYSWTSLVQAGLPVHFPSDVPLRVSTSLDQTSGLFEVIVTTSAATPDEEGNIFKLLNTRLVQHGLFLYSSNDTLLEYTQTKLLSQGYEITAVPQAEGRYFYKINLEDKTSLLFQILQQGIKFVQSARQILKRHMPGDPEAEKARAQWAKDLSLAKGRRSFEHKTKNATQLVWSIKMVLWTVYKVLAFIVSAAFQGSLKVVMLVLKAFYTFYVRLMYLGLLLLLLVSTVGLGVLGSVSGLSFFTMAFLSFLWKLRHSLFQTPRFYPQDVLRKVLKKLKETYKTTQLFWWVLLGVFSTGVLTVVSAYSYVIVADILTEIVDNSKDLFLYIVEQAKNWIQINPKASHWVFSTVPVTWLINWCSGTLPSAVQRFLLSPLQTYVLSYMSQLGSYQAIAANLAFLLWMQTTYDDVLIGPNREYKSGKTQTKIFYITELGGSLAVTTTQFYKGAHYMYLNNYFDSEAKSDVFCKKWQKKLDEKELKFLNTNRLRFLQGPSFLMLIDAVTYVKELLTVFHVPLQVTLNDVNSRLVNLMRYGQASMDNKLNALIENVTQNQPQENKVMLKKALQPFLNTPNNTAVLNEIKSSSKFTLTPELLENMETHLKFSEEVLDAVRTLHQNSNYLQDICDSLQVELIILEEDRGVLARVLSLWSSRQVRDIPQPVFEPSRVNVNEPPVYIYQNADGTFSPLFHLDLVVLAK
jgi:hypothetical protein